MNIVDIGESHGHHSDSLPPSSNCHRPPTVIIITPCVTYASITSANRTIRFLYSTIVVLQVGDFLSFDDAPCISASFLPWLMDRRLTSGTALNSDSISRITPIPACRPFSDLTVFPRSLTPLFFFFSFHRIHFFWLEPGASVKTSPWYLGHT